MRLRISLLLLLLGACVVAAILVAMPRVDFACVAQRVLHASDDYYDGWTCLHYAAIRGDLEAIDRILSHGVPVDKRNALGRTALMEAARDGDLAAVNRLLVHGADVNAHDEAGFTALQLAAKSLHPAVVRRLLRTHVNVNARNQWQQTALWLVSWQKQSDNTVIAHSLISNGAKVNLADEHGNTPLHMAARAGREDMVAYLLQAGAQADARNQQGRTPLYLAVIGNNLRSARLLLRHGANPNIRADNRTALQVALRKGYRDMADLLVAHGARGYQRYASRARTHRGRQALRSHQLQKAINAFTAALAVNPDSVTAHYYRGLALLRQGKPQKALQDFRRTLALTPSHAGALEHAAIAYTQLGKYQSAVEPLQHLIDIRPDDARAHHLLAKVQRKLGHKARAQANATKACHLGYKAAC